jgi:hypothetical protein
LLHYFFKQLFFRREVLFPRLLAFMDGYSVPARLMVRIAEGERPVMRGSLAHANPGAEVVDTGRGFEA